MTTFNPGDIAQLDQILSHLTAMAVYSGTSVAVSGPYSSGDTCQHDACHTPATFIVAALYGQPARTDTVYCATHFDDGGALAPTLDRALRTNNRTSTDRFYMKLPAAAPATTLSRPAVDHIG